MYKKLLFAATCCLLVTQSVRAQFQMDFGAGIAISGNKTLNFQDIHNSMITQGYDTSYYAYKISASAVGLYAYPKFHFTEISDYSLSLGAPIMLGFSG